MLLVAMPLCVCGHVDLLDSEITETSCHSHCHHDSSDSDEQESQCDSSEHPDLQFIWHDTKASFVVSALEDFDGDTFLQDIFPTVASFNFERTTRPPPSSIEKKVSNRQLHEIYSSYRL